MIVPALTSTEASRHIADRLAGRSSKPDYYELGAGAPGWQTIMEQLRPKLQALLTKFRNEDARSAGQGFDALLSPVLHEALPLDDRLAADDDFWRYLSCVDAFDLVVWRHKTHDADGKPGPPQVAHFGLGDRWECFGRRIWFRAELSKDTAKPDPYELTRRGGTDFWASGMLRVLYPSSRPIARALLRFQYPNEGHFLQGGVYRPQTLDLRGIRELYKRLRHFSATLALPTLGDDAAADLIDSLTKDLAPDDSHSPLESQH